MNTQIQAMLGAILLAWVGAAPTNEANPATLGIIRDVFDTLFGSHHGGYDRGNYWRGRHGRFESDDYDGDFDTGRPEYSDY